MTPLELFNHVNEKGYRGIVPGKNDPLGDVWASAIMRIFEKTANAAELPRSEKRHTVWLIWQWMYCELANMRSRVISGPEALRAAGYKIDDDLLSCACELFLKAEGIEP